MLEHASRRVIPGDVDFSMMYAAHDAFSHHLAELIQTSERGWAAPARWTMFTRQLHIHHTAEDTALWPRLRATISRSDELAVLDAMQSEHAQLDPLLERVAAAFAATRATDAVADLLELRAALGAHMRHEENAALPLVATHLGRAGWAAFGAQIRATQGLRGAATYLPWLLDGAQPSTVTAVLDILPRPVRLLYRRAWAPRYRRRLA